MSRRALGILFALALLVRLLVLLELRGTILAEVLVGDGQAFDAWGRRIAAGDWLGREVFYQAPLYPYFLGLVHALGGGTDAVRVLQALLGALGCVLVASASATLVDRRAGWAAGLLVALHAPAIWLDGLVQKGSLALVLSAGLLLAYARLATSGRARWAALLGLLLGGLVLLHENALALLVPFGLYLVLRRERRASLAAFLGAFALVLLPVGLRNAALGGTFLPTASNFGVNVYLGNGPGADGMYRPLVPGRGHPEFEGADARALAERALGRALTPAEVSFYWLGRARDEVLAHPGRWGALLAHKARLLVARTEIMDAEAFELHAASSRTLRVLGRVFHFGLLLPLAVLGLGLAWSRRALLWPVALSALALGASVVLVFVAARFRAGLVPFLAPFAGLGAVELGLRLPSAAGRRTLVLPGLAALACALLANGPLDLPGDPRATALGNLASELLRQGDFARALVEAQAALDVDPSDANALYDRGVAAMELGRTELAETSLRAAAEREPAYLGDATRLLGQMRAAAGDLAGAEALLLQSVAADPASPAAQHDLGRLRELQGRTEEARAQYRAALALDPDFAPSRAALARLAEGG